MLADNRLGRAFDFPNVSNPAFRKTERDLVDRIH